MSRRYTLHGAETDRDNIWAMLYLIARNDSMQAYKLKEKRNVGYFARSVPFH
jgi:hypothetical protein